MSPLIILFVLLAIAFIIVTEFMFPVVWGRRPIQFAWVALATPMILRETGVVTDAQMLNLYWVGFAIWVAWSVWLIIVHWPHPTTRPMTEEERRQRYTTDKVVQPRRTSDLTHLDRDY